MESKLDDVDVADIRIALQFFEHSGWGRTIEVQDSQCPPAGLVAVEAHVGNVHLVPGEKRAEMTNDSRPVLVIQQQQGAVDGDFHGNAEQPHDARIVG